jgi:hypothetical protein
MYLYRSQVDTPFFHLDLAEAVAVAEVGRPLQTLGPKDVKDPVEAGKGAFRRCEMVMTYARNHGLVFFRFYSGTICQVNMDWINYLFFM